VRAARATIAFVPSIVVEGIWLAYVAANHGGDARHFGWYGPAMPLMRKLLGINLWWFWPMPDTVSGAWVVVVKVIMVALFVALLVCAWRDPRARPVLTVLGLVFVLYNLVYITDRLVMDWPNNFELRNFSVTDVLLAIAVATSVGVIWPRHRILMTATIVAWLGAATYGSARFLSDAARETIVYDATARASAILSWVRADPYHREIYTNWNARVWRVTDRRTRNLPLVFNADTIKALGAAMARTHGVLIGWPSRLPTFSLRPDEMSSYATPDTIAALLHLPMLVRGRDGIVWGPPPEAPER
jgi:hypothetical protein